jgi:hypothetical protein
MDVGLKKPIYFYTVYILQNIQKNARGNFCGGVGCFSPRCMGFRGFFQYSKKFFPKLSGGVIKYIYII